VTPIRLHAALIIVTVVLSSCSRNEAPAESAAGSAAGSAAAAQLEAEVGERFRRPELQGYLMLPDSFVGGSFPKEIAVLLREVEELESKYVSLLQESSTKNQPVIEAHQALEQFARVAAELYEVMAAASASVKSMRDGLEISDASLAAEYDRRVDEVNAAKYVGSEYIQHNPDTPNGADAFIRSAAGFIAKFPRVSVEIKRVIAEGDMVVTHNLVKMSSEDRGMAGADIFRLRDGKIVEHWDVRQPIPEVAANDNTMF
jgi:predicted SnoaL-like aldol condensation-catalyzing enzyme